LFQLFASLGHQGLPAGGFQLLFRRLLLTSQLRHPLSQLAQRQQTFLVRIQKLVDLLFHAFEFLGELASPPLQRIAFQALLAPPLQLRSNQLRLLQQLGHLLPHQLIQIFHSNRTTCAGRVF